MMKFIDLEKQQKLIKLGLNKRINNVLEHGQYIKGPELKELETKLIKFTGAPYAIACANGTDALQIALMALDLQPGDEIITTPFTFFATGEVIALLKLKPVFVDIDPLTYNIEPNQIEKKITKKTKAIIPVSLYGQCSDMNEINAIASKHGLIVIEDAAQSFGAEYQSKKSCNLSTIATTSFFPSKPLGCYGDGGMMFTSDANLAHKLRCITDHGQETRYCHSMIGLNSRLDTLQAAILLAKLEVFQDEVISRQRIGTRYSKMLASHVKVPTIKNDRTSVYAQYTIEVENRAALAEKLQAAGIPTTVHYPVPLHLQPVFKDLGLKKGSFPLAEKAADHVISLPMHPYLSEPDQDLIVNTIKTYC